MKSSKGRRSKRGTELKTRDMMLVSVPKQICTLQWAPVLRFRWRPGGSPPYVLNQVFSIVNLLNTILCAKTSTTFNALFTFVKLRYIRLRASPIMEGSASSSFITLSLQDTAAAFAGNGVVYEAAPSGSEVSEIYVRPKPTQKWGQWNSIADSCSLTLTGSDIDLVIELGLSFRSQMGSSFTAVNTGTAALPGAVYFRGLDSLPDSSTLFPATVEVGSAI
jgi:hypothetical protein